VRLRDNLSVNTFIFTAVDFENTHFLSRRSIYGLKHANGLRTKIVLLRKNYPLDFHGKFHAQTDGMSRALLTRNETKFQPPKHKGNKAATFLSVSCSHYYSTIRMGRLGSLSTTLDGPSISFANPACSGRSPPSILAGAGQSQQTIVAGRPSVYLSAKQRQWCSELFRIVSCITGVDIQQSSGHIVGEPVCRRERQVCSRVSKKVICGANTHCVAFAQPEGYR
jgi:hypothetical protein